MRNTLREVKFWAAARGFPVRCQTDEQFTSEFSVIRETFSSGVIPGAMSERCAVFVGKFSVPDGTFSSRQFAC